jgi:sporulation protein YtfJ
VSENKVSDIIKSSLEGIKGFTDMETVIGNAIHTPSGVTVIPVSKITVGFAGGGVDFGAKKSTGNQNFGSGSGSGISITPIAFLTVDRDANISILHINNNADAGIERITSLIEHAPEIIQKAKSALKE